MCEVSDFVIAMQPVASLRGGDGIGAFLLLESLLHERILRDEITVHSFTVAGSASGSVLLQIKPSAHTGVPRTSRQSHRPILGIEEDALGC